MNKLRWDNAYEISASLIKFSSVVSEEKIKMTTTHNGQAVSSICEVLIDNKVTDGLNKLNVN